MKPYREFNKVSERTAGVLVFIGHYALGLASKRLAPSVSLGTLFLACQFADLLWPTLVMAGLESLSIRPGVTAVTPLDFDNYPY